MENNRVFLYLQVIFGSVLFALGLYFFITPSGLNSGGIIGFAQLFDYFIQSFVNVPVSLDLTGIINMALNIPLFMLAFRSISKEFCFKTIISLIIQTVLLSILPTIKEPIVEDALLNVAFAAIICGIGVGLALRSSGCCGGIDIATVCLVKKNPDFKAEWDALEPELSIMQAVIDARKESGLTQQQLAERTGISQADISKLENGNANPSLKTLQRLASAMDKKLKISFV